MTDKPTIDKQSDTAKTSNAKEVSEWVLHYYGHQPVDMTQEQQWLYLLAGELKRITEAEMPVEPKVYQQQFFCDDGTIESHEAVLKHDYDSLKAYAQRKDAEAIRNLKEKNT